MRRRKHYAVLVLGVVMLGLLSREVPGVPKWCGDVLWALMFFCFAGIGLPRNTSASNAVLAAVFAVGIETAKLYHTPWLDDFRRTTPGGLLLGHVFSWENILCYGVGVALGVVSERLWLKQS